MRQRRSPEPGQRPKPRPSLCLVLCLVPGLVLAWCCAWCQAWCRAWCCARGRHPGHQRADRFDGGVGDGDRRRQPAAGDHDQPIADLEQLVQFLGDDQQAGAGIAQTDQRLSDPRRRADVHSPGRLGGHQQLRAAGQLASDDEFLQVAARQAARHGPGAARLDVEVGDDGRGSLAEDPVTDQPGAEQCAVGVRQQQVAIEAEVRDGSRAESFLGDIGQAQCATDLDRCIAHGAPGDADRVARRAAVLADDRGQQFALAVSRDAGDTDDLAAAHGEVDGAERLPGAIDRGERQVTDLEHRLAGRGQVAARPWRLASDHHPRQARHGLARRFAAPGDPAGTHHRRARTERSHFVELVADVENRDPFACQLPQRPEQPVDGRRRQHRRRFVHDQQPWRQQQRADDLDPLAFADRQRVDRGVGVQRQAVALAERADVVGERVTRAGPAQSEQHVLGDRQRLEQREMLEHHADAERPRCRRRIDPHRRTVPSDLAGIGLDGAERDPHQGRLAGAVLADEAVDLARHHRERDGVVGQHRRVALGDLDQFEARLRGQRRRRRRGRHLASGSVHRIGY